MTVWELSYAALAVALLSLGGVFYARYRQITSED